ncbi:MAG: hypoxanthine phosphoribosyltransferase [Syntrophomonadaceae bacterium]|nr:hypoxanthine phosphoribosyltransferase [Syntrophomonadaceae bacterium]
MFQRERRVVLTQEQIKERVRELGEEITRDYQGQELLVVGILKGAFIFMADLVREIRIPVAIDFMDVSSYGLSTESTGVVRILKDLEESIEGRHVLVVEDIIDSGLTLNYISENLKSRDAASVKICAFLDKPSRRKAPIKADYLGFSVPDEFIVGYGLDYAEKYRHYPYVAILERDEYESK